MGNQNLGKNKGKEIQKEECPIVKGNSRREKKEEVNSSYSSRQGKSESLIRFVTPTQSLT